MCSRSCSPSSGRLRALLNSPSAPRSEWRREPRSHLPGIVLRVKTVTAIDVAHHAGRHIDAHHDVFGGAYGADVELALQVRHAPKLLAVGSLEGRDRGYGSVRVGGDLLDLLIAG